MAQLPHGSFNSDEVDPSTGIGPDPDFTGWQKMHITDSEMKPTKNGNGEYLQLVAEVIEGKFKGRKLWIRLNLVNQNSTAVEIAYRDLSAICHATGAKVISDSQQLHHKPMMVNVVYKDATDKGPAGNEASGFKAVDGSAPVGAAAPASTQEAPAQDAAAPPWKRAS